MHDPRKQPQREAIRAECAKRRIAIEQRGQGYRLRGPGVDLAVVDLSQLDISDLQPHYPRERLRA